jgi:hypothetical protein
MCVNLQIGLRILGRLVHYMPINQITFKLRMDEWLGAGIAQWHSARLRAG